MAGREIQMGSVYNFKELLSFLPHMTNDVINILRPSSVDGSTWFAAQLATLGSGSLTWCSTFGRRILPLIIARSRLADP